MGKPYANNSLCRTGWSSFYSPDFSSEGNSARKNPLICVYHMADVTKALEKGECCSAGDRERTGKGAVRLQWDRERSGILRGHVKCHPGWIDLQVFRSNDARCAHYRGLCHVIQALPLVPPAKSSGFSSKLTMFAALIAHAWLLIHILSFIPPYPSTDEELRLRKLRQLAQGHRNGSR